MLRHSDSDPFYFFALRINWVKRISRCPEMQDFCGESRYCRHSGKASSKVAVVNSRLSNPVWFVFSLYVYSIHGIFHFAMRIVYRLYRLINVYFCRYAQKQAYPFADPPALTVCFLFLIFFVLNRAIPAFTFHQYSGSIFSEVQSA